MTTIILAADHGGFTQKQQAAAWLTQLGHQVIDVGATQLWSEDDFPDYVWEAVKAWRQNPSENKIGLWCRSGVGMMMQANRFTGVRAGLGISVDHLRQAVADDHLNALALASDWQPWELQQQLIEIFLTTPWQDGEKYVRRISKLDALAKL